MQRERRGSFTTPPLGFGLDGLNRNADLDGDERFVPMLPRILRQLLVQNCGLSLDKLCFRYRQRPNDAPPNARHHATKGTMVAALRERHLATNRFTDCMWTRISTMSLC